MRLRRSLANGERYVDLDGTEGCEEVVDACLELGALVQRYGAATRFVVRFPGRGIEELTGAELKRELAARQAQ